MWINYPQTAEARTVAPLSNYVHQLNTCKMERYYSKYQLKQISELGKNNKTHGLSGTKEYLIWKSMRKRCNNPNDKSYYRYGGRGIKVDSRWDKFENFIEDMGMRPSNKQTIERIDNYGDYSFNNCCWATYKEQANNTRRNIVLIYNNESHNLMEWSILLNLNYDMLRQRIKRGWSVDKILNK